MSEKTDLIDSDIQTSVRHEIEQTVSLLDQRMAAHFQTLTTPSASQRTSWFSMRTLKPALALGSVVLMLGIGYWLGRLQNNASGVIALSSDSPTMVATSKSPGFASLYESLTGKENLKEWYERTLSPASESTSASAAAPTADTDATQQSASESEIAAAAEETPSESAAATTLMSANSVTQAQGGQVNLELLISGLLSAQVASVGRLRDDLISPVDNAVVRLKSSGERQLLVSQMRTPKGVAISATGQIYFTEYQPDGALLALGDRGEATVIQAGLVYPAGIAFAEDQSLYLAEQGRGRVLRFQPVNGAITPDSAIEVFSSGFSGMLETDSLDNLATHGGPFALAISPDNQMLVSDYVDGATVIYRFSLDPNDNFWDWLFKDS